MLDRTGMDHSAYNRARKSLVARGWLRHENEAARTYCGIKPRKDGKPYQLNAMGAALRMAVEARLKSEAAAEKPEE